MGMPHIACSSLGVTVDKHIAYEIAPGARGFLADNFADFAVRTRVVGRDKDELAFAHVFTAGFPCQPFSFLGLQQARKDNRGRGSLVLESLRCLRQCRPTIAIFENVRGFAAAERGISTYVVAY